MMTRKFITTIHQLTIHQLTGQDDGHCHFILWRRGTGTGMTESFLGPSEERMMAALVSKNALVKEKGRVDALWFGYVEWAVRSSPIHSLFVG